METENVYLKPITLKNIMKFALPTIAMSLFMAFYTMVDGLFVSNLIGTNALSAINLSATYRIHTASYIFRSRFPSRIIWASAPACGSPSRRIPYPLQVRSPGRIASKNR